MSRERPPRKPPSEVRPSGGLQRVQLTLRKDNPPLPVTYATRLLLNFTGKEFIVNVLDATPPPFLGNSDSPAPTKIEARVIARYAFSVIDWLENVRSFNQQIERLQAEGAFRLEVVEPEEGEHP